MKIKTTKLPKGVHSIFDNEGIEYVMICGKEAGEELDFRKVKRNESTVNVCLYKLNTHDAGNDPIQNLARDFVNLVNASTQGGLRGKNYTVHVVFLDGEGLWHIPAHVTLGMFISTEKTPTVVIQGKEYEKSNSMSNYIRGKTSISTPSGEPPWEKDLREELEKAKELANDGDLARMLDPTNRDYLIPHIYVKELDKWFPIDEKKLEALGFKEERQGEG